MRNSLDGMRKFFASLAALAFGGAFWACSTFETAGTSEEAEGVVAIVDKNLAGVVQKGPFVTGSSIVLKETSASGNFKPTGREFFATTRSDKGDFKIDGINLESQYVRITATGYYKREQTGENSACQISLNALSDISNRDQVNVNVLTHLEYDRTLALIKKGMTFTEAKKQARQELMKTFYYDDLVEDSENLNINNSGDADKALKKISTFVDHILFGEEYGTAHWHSRDYKTYYTQYEEDPEKYCEEVQNYLDNFADILAGDDYERFDSQMLHDVLNGWFMED
ncbi:hypothetical protein [Fibrobacter sp.]|uniref:hypothetical protein n=1 Tax=Fibrobacter sp. TaxID=35828 RepID=UPI003890E758